MKLATVVSLSILASASIAVFAADASVSTKGWISDSMCGAKHAGTGAACAKKCIDGGSKPVFVDEAKKQVWTIDNPDAVKDAYGKHVALTGTSDSTAKSMHVTGVSVIAD